MHIKMAIYFITNIAFWIFITKYLKNSLKAAIKKSGPDFNFHKAAWIHAQADLYFIMILTILLSIADKLVLNQSIKYMYIFIIPSIIAGLSARMVPLGINAPIEGKNLKLIKNDRSFRTFTLSYVFLNIILVIFDCMHYYI